jgi:hypothetical protein
MDKLVRDAESYNSEARQRFDMGAAESTVGQADEAARNEAERQLQSYGINPNSGRYQDLMLTSRIQDAAARAGAGTQAGLNTANIGRQMQLQAAQLGQNLPGMAVNALNSAYQGVTGAQNAELGMLNTGANLVNTATPLFNASASANHLPPVGNVSRNQSTNESTSTSRNASNSMSGLAPKHPPYDDGSGDKQQKQPQEREQAPQRQQAGRGGTAPGTGSQGTGREVNNPFSDQTDEQPPFYADPNMLWSNPTTTGPENTDWNTNQQQFGGQTDPNAAPNVQNWNAGYPFQPAPGVDTYQNLEQYGPQNQQFGPQNDQTNTPVGSFDNGVIQNAGYNPQDFAAPQGGMQNNQWGDYFTNYGDSYNNAVNDYQNQYSNQDTNTDTTNYTDNNYNDPQQQDNYYTQDNGGGYDQVSQNDYNDYTQNDNTDYSNYDTTSDYGNDNSYQDNTDYTNYDSGGDYGYTDDYAGFAGGGVIPNRTTGGPVPNNASPSRGRVTDDVPARLNAGEFVMPRDVVQHLGTSHFHKLIEKSRKARTGMAGPPARPTMRPALQQRPTFQSRQM